MARSHLAWRSAWPGPASRTASLLARPLRATLAAAAGLALAGAPLLAGPAAADQAQAAALPAPLRLNVISFSPSFAVPGRTITITGRIRNTTSSPVSNLTVAALSAANRFGSRAELVNFAHGRYQPGETQVTGAPAVSKLQLDAGHSWAFTLRLPVSALGFSCFGVYPLTVQVSDSALQVASEPVPLPYWPSAPAGCAGGQRPAPFPVSWIWPLTDVPHQGVCAGLTDNRLAASLGPAGRLGYLLAVGRRYATSAALTWAADPALLESARATGRPHDVGFSSRCNDITAKPASQNARRWLAGLARATAGRPLFVTPFADVDAAALAKYGDRADLIAAQAVGDKVAREILGRVPAPASGQVGPRQLSPIAWPPGGNASEALLDDLAGNGTSTVILTAPPASASTATYTPGAVTSKLTGIGQPLHVLLADRQIRTLLGSRQAASSNSGDIFRVAQLYLAQTAMIAAEQPATVRPILVAPPRRWNPPRRLASGLLADTVAAPWLTPVTANHLATLPPEHLYPRLVTSVSRGELSRSLLKQVGQLKENVALLKSVQLRPDPNLDRAVFAIESSAWRGEAGKHAKLLLARTKRYVRKQLGGLSIRGSNDNHSVLHVTFGGRNSSVPVAIFNDLSYPARVRLHVSAKNAQVRGVPRTITIAAGNYSTVKITVRAAKNRQGVIRLSLTAPDGRPLPESYPLTIVVRTTDLGVIALAIGSAVLALFVIASAMRAIRTGRPAAAAPTASVATPGSGDDGRDREASGPDADPERRGFADSELTKPESADSDLAGAAMMNPAPGGVAGIPPADNSGRTQPHQHQPPVTDAEIAAQRLVQAGSRPEHIGSASADGAELASARTPLADQEPAPGRRGNRERR